MDSFYKRITTIVKKNWGIVILLGFIIPIILVNYKPDLTLMGWDNFSGSQDILLNIKRSLLLTWRNFRGFGVASDAETVDLFRLIVLYPLSLMFELSVLDQLYLFLSLILGVLGLYLFVRELFSNIGRLKEGRQGYIEIAAVFAALFYLWNLNTLSTFYTPMIMFIARFWLYPFSLYLLTKIYYAEEFKLRHLILLIIILFFGATAYLTPTVFIVLLLVISLLIINQIVPGKIVNSLRRGLFFLSLVFLINAFWLLPFVNYGLNTSAEVAYTSNNIQINQHVLNSPPNEYSWYRTLTLYPDVLDTEPGIDPVTGESQNMYVDKELLTENGFVQVFLLVFPVLAIIGSIFIVVRERSIRFTFVPILLFIAIVTLRKSAPPFGFIFDFLSEYIPFFEQIFRFGETKFAPIFAIFGAVAIGYFLAVWTEVFIKTLGKKVGTIVVFFTFFILIIAPSIYTYQSYYLGNFIYSTLFVDFPDEYQEVADYIDSHSEGGRVLHLPYDEHSYWRTYNWGYFGSSFMNFIMETPLHERTFEPGSYENDDLYKSLISSIKIKDSEQFISSIENAGIEYLIVDETVSSDESVRKYVLWGDFHQENLLIIVDELEKNGDISLVKTESINIEKIGKSYGTWDDLSEELKESLLSNTDLKVYKVENFARDVQVIDRALTINEDISVLRNPIQGIGNTIQSKMITGINPIFKNQKIALVNNGSNFEFSLGDKHDYLSATQIDSSDEAVVNVFMKQSGEYLEVSINKLISPLVDIGNLEDNPEGYEFKIPLEMLESDINDRIKVDEIASDWHVLAYEGDFSRYRLKVNEIIIPVPISFDTEFTYIGSVLVSEPKFEISLLSPEEQIKNIPALFEYTEDPNCTLDKSESYYRKSAKLENDGSLLISSEFGTTCATAKLTHSDTEVFDYYENKFIYKVDTEESDKVANPFNSTSYNPNLTNYHDTSPAKQKVIRGTVDGYEDELRFDYCLIDALSGNCLNNHHSLYASDEDKVITIPGNYDNDSVNARVLIKLYNPGVKSNLQIKDLKVIGYEETLLDTLTLEELYAIDIKGDLDGIESLYIPKALSKSSYYYNPSYDALELSMSTCVNNNQYQAVKRVDDLTISYVENCDNRFSYTGLFDTNDFYLWNVSSNVLAGKHPYYVYEGFSQEFFDRYSNDIERLDDRELEVTHSPIVRLDKDGVNEIIQTAEIHESFDYFYPYGYDEPRIGHQSILHESMNQGVMVIDNFQIVQLPSSWENWMLVSEDSQVNSIDATLSDVSIGREFTTFKLTSEDSGNVVIKTGQGFDDQWRLYKTDNLFVALFGLNEVNTEHVKVNGWSNGYIIDLDEPAEGEDYMVFYEPLRLSILGALITGFSIILFVAIYASAKIERREKK